MTNQTWSPSKACADFVADLQYADIPAAVIDTMKRDTLDWIGCAVGGAADRSSQPIKAVADAVSYTHLIGTQRNVNRAEI